MTAQTRSVNKGKFEGGDTPQESDYVDLIDSFVSLSDTTVQAVSSPLTVTVLGVSATASATNFECLGAITSPTITTSALNVSGNVVIQGDLDVQGTLEFTQTDVGEIYLEATAAVSASASYVELVAAASSDATFLVNFATTAGSVIYQGTATRSFIGMLSVSLAASGANTNTFLTFGVDASALTRLEVNKELGTSTDEMETHGMLRLSQNQRVSPMLRGDSGNADGWIVKRLIMTVKE
jgi:hypothetical protein